ncbi:hypothetical protein RRG08_019672 [Elysia crispata]|uniref:Uncharacterized protein n=1 Tax=Elysia crispata TaxID=231223 RepID=A0AAE0YVY3_9GAST|nr:hypothetical protein RRG08_019672 [Elysia crispata]
MDFIVPISSVLIFFLNGYILFRRWLSKRVASDMSYIELVALVDPLITAIVCPMTSDLLYTPEWLSGCSSPYTIIITSVIVVLSLCSLVVCRRLIELALPCSSSGSMLPCRIPPWVPSSVAPLTFVFVSSTVSNKGFFQIVLVLNVVETCSSSQLNSSVFNWIHVWTAGYPIHDVHLMLDKNVSANVCSIWPRIVVLEGS